MLAMQVTQSTCRFMLCTRATSSHSNNARESPLGGCRLEWIPSMVNWIYPESYINLISHNWISQSTRMENQLCWRGSPWFLRTLSHLLIARKCLWQFPQVAVSHTIFDLALKPNASEQELLEPTNRPNSIPGEFAKKGHKMAVKTLKW